MVHRPWKAIAVLAAVLGGVALSSSEAQAGLLPVKVTVTPDAGNFRFAYNVILTSDSTLHAGDFFTIYDFAGYVEGSNGQPDGFSFSTSATGATPAGTVPSDDPGIPNLTWTYDGPTVLLGQVGLGNFTAISIHGETTTGEFTARTHREVDGQVDNNITDTEVAVGLSDPPSVPEPATLALFAAGLPLVGAARMLRRRQK